VHRGDGVVHEREGLLRVTMTEEVNVREIGRRWLVLGPRRSRSRGTRRPAVRAFFFACLGVCVLQQPVSAAERGGVAARADRFNFDVPAQSLSLALDALSATTGLDLLYDSGLAAHHRSPDLKGSFTAEEALSLLLAGSGLNARAIADGAITIAPAPRTRPGASPHDAYFAMIQESFAKAFCGAGTSPSRGRAVVRLRIKSTGEMERLEVLDETHGSRPDQAMADALGRIRLSGPPPADLPQPVMVLILPHSSAEVQSCSSGR
jgi:hypothetical protein